MGGNVSIAFTVVYPGRAGQGRRADLGLASLNNFDELWGTEAVFSGLGSGPGIIRVDR